MSKRLVITIDYPGFLSDDDIRKQGYEITGSFLHPWHPDHEPGVTCTKATFTFPGDQDA